MSLAVEQIAIGGYDDNLSYLIYDTESLEAVIVDPSGDTTLIERTVGELGLTVIAVWLTHTHHDHYDGLSAVLQTYGTLPIFVYESGREALEQYETVITLEDHQSLSLGSGRATVLYTPGHSDDSVCFFIPADYAAGTDPVVITGDTLFVGGCGRTSAHRVKDLYESLAELRALPPKTIVYPGHDYGETLSSTIEHELATNKYYLVKDFSEFQSLRLG